MMTIAPGDDKGEAAFRTIGEVSETLDVPQHVLRFWETRFSQIKPVKRAGGRRYYRPEDVQFLTEIKRLLYGEGYTIRGVQKLIKDEGFRAATAQRRPTVPAKVSAPPAAPISSAALSTQTSRALDREALRRLLKTLDEAEDILSRAVGE